MYRYKCLLISLDGSEQDIAVIRYAAKVAQLAKTEKAYFVHVVEGHDTPEAVRADYPVLVRKSTAEVKATIEVMVGNHFSVEHTAEVVCEVIEGPQLGEVLRFSRDKEIDLILVGRKGDSDDPGRISVKLARKAPCSVLVVPEGAVPNLTTILVPVDFSEHSRDAMDVAIAFAQAAGLPEVLCLFVYSVPVGYHKTGKTYEQFGEIMRDHAEVKWKDFVEACDLKGVRVTPLLELDENSEKGIQRVSEREQATLLVLGARGRTPGAAVLLGSVTEHLIHKTHIPLLAVKRKGTGLSFLEAFLKM